MKKLSIIFIISLLLVGIIISCDNKVNDNINETVSISFNNLSSRAISSSVENFDATKLYWKYSAKKNSADNNPNLNSSSTSNYDSDTTGAVTIIGPGLNATLSGFSQGLWDFKLFAYKKSDYTQLAYGGEAKGVRLEWGKDNVVNVEVSPYIDKNKGNGTIDLSKLTVKCGEDKIDNWSISSVSFNPTTTSSFSGNKLTNVTPGTYEITITIKNGADQEYEPLKLDQNITVYSNLTTTLTGEITVVASTPAVPPGLIPIGGVIFNVVEGVDNGANYTFYDEGGNVIPEGDGYTVNSLKDAIYYTSDKIEGEYDKFYVLYTRDHLFTEGVCWGFDGTPFGDTIGKSNTTTILQYITENDLLNPDNSSSTSVYKNCGDGLKYVWDYIIAFNDKDWESADYIGDEIYSAIDNTTELYDW